LVAVVPEGEGLLKVLWEGLEAGEMLNPLLVVELAEPYAIGPALVSEAEGVEREAGGLDRIVEAFAEL
jgi:hypothetical protein